MGEKVEAEDIESNNSIEGIEDFYFEDFIEYGTVFSQIWEELKNNVEKDGQVPGGLDMGVVEKVCKAFEGADSKEEVYRRLLGLSEQELNCAIRILTTCSKFLKTDKEFIKKLGERGLIKKDLKLSRVRVVFGKILFDKINEEKPEIPENVKLLADEAVRGNMDISMLAIADMTSAQKYIEWLIDLTRAANALFKARRSLKENSDYRLIQRQLRGLSRSTNLTGMDLEVKDILERYPIERLSGMWRQLDERIKVLEEQMANTKKRATKAIGGTPEVQ